MKTIEELNAELRPGMMLEIDGEPYVLKTVTREWSPDPSTDRFYMLTLSFRHTVEEVITKSLSEFDS